MPISSLANDRALRQGIIHEIQEINLFRLGRLLWIFIVVHGVHVVLFSPYTPNSASATETWRNGIMIAHGAMMVLSGIIGAAALIPRLRRSKLVSLVMPPFTALAYLLFGATLAIIDQLVTSAITPLFIAFAGVGMFILVNPIISIINYVIAFAFFFIFVAHTQTATDILLSIRVNSLSATGTGLGISLLLWRNQVHTLLQKRQIETQQRELERKNEALSYLANHDALTGLANRSLYFQRAEAAIADIRHHGNAGCLILIDIDHFKQINDTYGHQAGDYVLKEVSRILARITRDSDTLARMGGEEFAAILAHCTLHDAVQIAERMRNAIEQHPFAVKGRRIHVSASFGIAMLNPHRPDPLTECYNAADKALYDAKGGGRNRVHVA